MKLEPYFSRDRLAIAWQHLQGGQNHAYKYYFKHIYQGYEVALEENLEALSSRLVSGGFKNKTVQRIFIPKSPTSQRPLTLLSVEDQIAYQAFAAFVADKIAPKRREFEFKCVFSNVLAEDRTQFIFENWKYCYEKYQDTTEAKVKAGKRWVVTCDLASFYDTISHDILFSQIPTLKKHCDEREHFSNILSGWTFENPVESRKHGLPQGPIASDLLAEAFMMVLDQRLCRENIDYTRYVDDIRIFSTSHTEAQKIALHLERIFRGIGLVPQPDKFSILELSTGLELHKIFSSPTHQYADDPDNDKVTLSAADAEKVLSEALESEDIQKKKPPNPTLVRYAFFRGKSNAHTRRIALDLCERYPQFTESAFVFLRRYADRGDVVKLAIALLNTSPFGYVKYKSWAFLHFTYFDLNPRVRSSLSEEACRTLKNQNSEEPSHLLGAAQFVLRHSKEKGNRQNAFVFNLSNRFVLAMALRYLKSKPFGLMKTGYGRIHSDLPDIGLGILHQFDKLGGDLKASLSKKKKGQSPYVRSLDKLFGSDSGPSVDPVSQGIQELFGIDVKINLKMFLGNRWLQGLRYIAKANLYRDRAPGIWLRTVNQLGELLVRAAIGKHNCTANKKTVIKMLPKNGKKSPTYGHLIEARQKLSTLYPGAFDGFRELNTRRNNDSESHAIDEKTGRRTKSSMNKREQKALNKSYTKSLQQLLQLIETHKWL